MSGTIGASQARVRSSDFTVRDGQGIRDATYVVAGYSNKPKLQIILIHLGRQSPSPRRLQFGSRVENCNCWLCPDLEWYSWLGIKLVSGIMDGLKVFSYAEMHS